MTKDYYISSKLLRTRIIVYLNSRNQSCLIGGALCILFSSYLIFVFIYIPTNINDFDQVGIGEAFLSSLESKGRSWVPITETRIQSCYNLERNLRSFGDITSNERETWTSLNCLDLLRELYGRW